MKTLMIFLNIWLVLSSAIIGLGCRADECVAGVNCDCVGGECDILCGGESKAGCDMHCTEGAECLLRCPGGGCNIYCDGAQSCEMKCGNGGCNMKCTNTASCQITACVGNCNLDCGGAAQCGSACTAAQSCGTTP